MINSYGMAQNIPTNEKKSYFTKDLVGTLSNAQYFKFMRTQLNDEKPVFLEGMWFLMR